MGYIENRQADLENFNREKFRSSNVPFFRKQSTFINIINYSKDLKIVYFKTTDAKVLKFKSYIFWTHKKIRTTSIENKEKFGSSEVLKFFSKVSFFGPTNRLGLL